MMGDVAAEFGFESYEIPRLHVRDEDFSSRRADREGSQDRAGVGEIGLDRPGCRVDDCDIVIVDFVREAGIVRRDDSRRVGCGGESGVRWCGRGGGKIGSEDRGAISREQEGHVEAAACRARGERGRVISAQRDFGKGREGGRVDETQQIRAGAAHNDGVADKDEVRRLVGNGQRCDDETGVEIYDGDGIGHFIDDPGL